MRNRKSKQILTTALLGVVVALVVGIPAWGSTGFDVSTGADNRAVKPGPHYTHTGQDSVPPDSGSDPPPHGGGGEEITDPNVPPTLGDVELPCPGDADGDGMVDINDLLLVVLAWGPCDGFDTCAADLTGDGTVDVFDLIEIVMGWGTCP